MSDFCPSPIFEEFSRVTDNNCPIFELNSIKINVKQEELPNYFISKLFNSYNEDQELVDYLININKLNVSCVWIDLLIKTLIICSSKQQVLKKKICLFLLLNILKSNSNIKPRYYDLRVSTYDFFEEYLTSSIIQDFCASRCSTDKICILLNLNENKTDLLLRIHKYFLTATRKNFKRFTKSPIFNETHFHFVYLPQDSKFCNIYCKFLVEIKKIIEDQVNIPQSIQIWLFRMTFLNDNTFDSELLVENLTYFFTFNEGTYNQEIFRLFCLFFIRNISDISIKLDIKSLSDYIENRFYDVEIVNIVLNYFTQFLDVAERKLDDFISNFKPDFHSLTKKSIQLLFIIYSKIISALSSSSSIDKMINYITEQLESWTGNLNSFSTEWDIGRASNLSLSISFILSTCLLNEDTNYDKITQYIKKLDFYIKETNGKDKLIISFLMEEHKINLMHLYCYLIKNNYYPRSLGKELHLYVGDLSSNSNENEVKRFLETFFDCSNLPVDVGEFLITCLQGIFDKRSESINSFVNCTYGNFAYENMAKLIISEKSQNMDGKFLSLVLDHVDEIINHFTWNLIDKAGVMLQILHLKNLEGSHLDECKDDNLVQSLLQNLTLLQAFYSGEDLNLADWIKQKPFNCFQLTKNAENLDYISLFNFFSKKLENIQSHAELISFKTSIDQFITPIVDRLILFNKNISFSLFESPSNDQLTFFMRLFQFVSDLISVSIRFLHPPVKKNHNLLVLLVNNFITYGNNEPTMQNIKSLQAKQHPKKVFWPKLLHFNYRPALINNFNQILTVLNDRRYSNDSVIKRLANEIACVVNNVEPEFLK